MSQWYENDPDLLRAEIEEMNRLWPDAETHYLSDGRMSWSLKVSVPIVAAEPKMWTFLAVYDPDYPRRLGCVESVRIYPVKPNLEEMRRRVEQAQVGPKSIPHILRDSGGGDSVPFSSRCARYEP